MKNLNLSLLLMGLAVSRLHAGPLNLPGGQLPISTMTVSNTVAVDGSVSILDEYGWNAENTPMNELRVIEPVRLVGATFGGASIDPNFWNLTLTNNATAYQLNNEIVLQSSISANGYAILQSSRTARYNGGNSNRFRGQVQLDDAGTAGNQRRWGMFNGTDGAYFMSSGTVLYACTMRAGVETAIASTSWNGSGGAPTLTNCNVYEIYITNTKVYYSINGVLSHTASFPLNTWSATCNLPVRLDSQNTGNTTKVNLRCRVATIYRLGPLHTLPTKKHISSAATTVCKNQTGFLVKIVVNNPTNNAITVYDSTAASGDIIAIINPGSSAVPVTLEYGVPFSNGLTVVTAGSPDLTVVYE